MAFADDLVAAFEPWLTDDLEDYLRAIASMFTEVELLAMDNETDEGWVILFDPDLAPAKALPYLAQYVGENLPTGLGEAESREWIKDRPNSRRGTMRAIFLAAQRKLTGSRIVAWKERDGAVDDLTVITYDAQTPDPAGTEADIRSVTPADVRLNYESRLGQSWQDVLDGSPTWQDVDDDYDSWLDVATTLGSGYTTFSRPRP